MKLDIKKILNTLFPLPRSLMGNGTLKSLEVLSEIIDFQISYFESGYKADEWEVPKEWIVNGSKLIVNNKNYADFFTNNLHLVNYSEHLETQGKLTELRDFVYFNRDLPDAIPYVTSYYKNIPGVCIKYTDYEEIKNKKAQIEIDSEFINGKLPIAEAYIEGRSKKEIILNSYLCHPSMGNNELSGPIVMAALYEKLKNRDNLYSFRFLIAPESIGVITYLSKNLQKIRDNIEFGLVLTCLGGPEKNISYKLGPNNIQNYFSDYLQTNSNVKFRTFDPNEGSNERHFTFPNVELPFGQFAKTVYGKYKEYHTSLDNLQFVNTKSLNSSINDIYDLLIGYESFNKNDKKIIQPKINYLKSLDESLYKPAAKYGEPFLSKYNLYPDINSDGSSNYLKTDLTSKLMQFLSLCNGLNTIEFLQNKLNIDNSTIEILKKEKIINIV